jgi:hypothetical protein
MEKGLKEIQEQAEKDAIEFSKNRINFVSLGDREVAELRFLTDSEDLIKAKIHTITEMTPKGKRFRKKYCTMQDLGSCTYCSQGDGLKSLIYLWSWVFMIYHTQQNPKLAQYQDAVKWTPVKLGDGKTYYKETINGPMVFRISVGQKGAYQNMIIGFARDYGTLTDRNYRFSRTGKELDTTYNITPLKESPMPEEAVEAMKALPDLGDVITGKVKRFGQDEETPTEETMPGDFGDIGQAPLEEPPIEETENIF